LNIRARAGAAGAGTGVGAATVNGSGSTKKYAAPCSTGHDSQAWFYSEYAKIYFLWRGGSDSKSCPNPEILETQA
jgi:hypothetical protein